mmetsp:Transcript_9948/g.14060  ORF Transcript_9948/g.14060 Transcript_9948/m.14060 type:complete len:324 (-) Transcript_9948:81-1052(-)
MKLSLSVIALSVSAAAAFAPSSLPFVRPGTSLNAEVTAALIKELRESTGAGMMDCKKALVESDGDMSAAVDFLREKGLGKADKKASRVAAEGKIVAATAGDKSVVVEVNCETDFVAKDANFLGFAQSVADAALGVEGEDISTLLATEVDGSSIDDTRQAMVSKIGENIQVRRMAAMGGEGSTTASYIHMGKIGVLVELEGGSEELATDVAMHIAAMSPPYATADEVPQEELEKERRILTVQAADSGKPAEIVEKMVEGRIRKYLEEICLVSQSFVKSTDKTVGQLLEENGAKIKGFKRLQVGEGIEKKQEDFAAEVAAAVGGN